MLTRITDNFTVAFVGLNRKNRKTFHCVHFSWRKSYQSFYQCSATVFHLVSVLCSMYIYSYCWQHKQ